MKEMFQIFKLTFQEKNKLMLSLLFSVLVASFTYIFVDLVQPIVDYMLKADPQASVPESGLLRLAREQLNIYIQPDQLVKIIPVVLVIVLFGKGLFTFLASLSMRAIGLNIVRGLRNQLYEHLIYQSMHYFDRTATGELMSRLTNDVDRIQEAVAGSMKDFFQEIFVLMAIFVFIFVTDWRLALVSFIVTPMAVIPLAIFSIKLKKRGRINQERMARIYGLLHETITGSKIVKSFTMEKFELKKFFEATKKYFKAGINLAVIASLSSPLMELIGGIVGAFILFAGSVRIAQGHITPGEFSAFAVALFYSYTPIKRISRANNSIQHGIASYSRVMEVLKSRPQIVDHPDAEPLVDVQGHVVFKDVSFSYDMENFVLKNVNFEVKPNEIVAIVGLSGAGKTTIVNLLSRFYNPTSGTITIDEKDITKVTLSSLRSQIGLVTQDLILFNDSVSNNIAYGLENPSDEKIRNAAKVAKAHEFIMDLSQEYQTNIGEKGILLSSGQRQRLAIARAVLKDPPILVLDEATSALDSESERLVQAALSNVMKNRTTFVIAHRLSTIRNANKILVVDKGKIAEVGTHAQLIGKNGIYKKLHDLQFPEEKEE